MRKVFISFALLLGLAICVSAQNTTGRLSGTVSSSDGVLPGATVTATDAGTGKAVTATTNGEGYFLFPSLEFGLYNVTISNEGFKTYLANDVKIDVGREYTLNTTLEIGSVSETVEVTAGADVVTEGTAQVSNTVSPQQILSLPLVTRNPLSLTTLQAGVTSNSAQNTTINGMRTTMTNITRDGVNIQDTFIRSNATDFAPGRPSVDDTGEFTIALSNAEADQGYGGAQIRLVTPRGSKEFSGALFAYNRNSAFAANSFFNNRTPNNPDGSQAEVAKKPAHRNRNQFGGKLSGRLPVPGFGEGTPFFFKDKGYFFVAYERVSDPDSSARTRTIFTDSARNGAFSWNRTNSTSVTPYCPSQTVGSVCTIPNILTYARSVLAGGSTIPASISPIISSRVLSPMPTTSNFTDGDGLNTAGYRLLRQSNTDRNQFSTRVDVDINQQHSILGIFNYNKETNLRPDVETTKFDIKPGVTQSSTNTQYTGAWRWALNETFNNEFRAGWFTSDVPFDRTDAIPSYILSIPLVTFPENTFLSQGRNTGGLNFQNNASYILGNHILKFGGQLQYFKVDAYNDAGIVPVVTVGTGTNTPAFTSTNFSSLGGISTTQLGTANGLMGLLGGLFSGVSQQFNLTDQTSGFQATRLTEPMRYANHSLYFADRWQIREGLTLSLGMRYEIYPAMKLTSGLGLEPHFASIDNPQASLLDINGYTDYVGGNAGVPKQYYKTDLNNFAPNVGFSWSPKGNSGFTKFLFGTDSRSVIRGGYSHIYGNDSIVTSIRNAGSSNAGVGRTSVPLSNLNGRLDDSVPSIAAPAFTAPPRTYIYNNQVNNFFGTVFGIDPNIQIPRIQQYNVGFQREFFGNTAFEIRYVGTRSSNLARGTDLNQVDIVNSGFLADFIKAQANYQLTGNAFCTTAGCQTLSIFKSGGAAAAGRLVIGTGGYSLTSFNNSLANGTPADLAIAIINSSSNYNNHPTVSSPNNVPRVALLPNPAAGAVDYHLNDGWYQYDSLQFEVRRRLSSGLYFQGNYTFSKNLTNSVGTSQALFEPYLDNNQKNLEKQRADYDQTHVFAFNGIYQLPFGKGQPFLNNGGFVDAIFGGWELSGIVQWASGAPITFVDTRGTLNRSGRSSRQTVNTSLSLDQVRALTGIYEANGNIYWIDPSILNSGGQASAGYGSTAFAGQVFFNVDPGQTGTLQRSAVDGPSRFNTNAALLKTFRFGESRMKLQFRAEAFNLFNNVNLYQNTQFANINSTSFGRITSAESPREMQFAARFEF